MAQPTDLSNMLQVVDKYVLSIGGCHVSIQKALTVSRKDKQHNGQKKKY
jgi:hypothetical protein